MIVLCIFEFKFPFNSSSITLAYCFLISLWLLHLVAIKSVNKFKLLEINEEFFNAETLPEPVSKIIECFSKYLFCLSFIAFEIISYKPSLLKYFLNSFDEITYINFKSIVYLKVCFHSLLVNNWLHYLIYFPETK